MFVKPVKGGQCLTLPQRPFARRRANVDENNYWLRREAAGDIRRVNKKVNTMTISFNTIPSNTLVRCFMRKWITSGEYCTDSGASLLIGHASNGAEIVPTVCAGCRRQTMHARFVVREVSWRVWSSLSPDRPVW
ncbi:phage protein [Escherichia coli]|uniref:Phage protein n=1 Tax=Escherichia coli TaxID=562 RepID=A0A377E1D7_ECOLX|nr:phage protein [Escherichia coli]